MTAAAVPIPAVARIPDPPRFRRLLGIAQSFTSNDGARPVLCAVKLTPTRLYATDSYALVRIGWRDDEAGGFEPVLIDRDDVADLRRMLSRWNRPDAPMSLHITPDDVTLRAGFRSLTVPTLRADYPNIDGLLDEVDAKPKPAKRRSKGTVIPDDLPPPDETAEVYAMAAWQLARLKAFEHGNLGAAPLTIRRPGGPLKPWRLRHESTNSDCLIMPVRLP